MFHFAQELQHVNDYQGSLLGDIRQVTTGTRIALCCFSPSNMIQISFKRITVAETITEDLRSVAIVVNSDTIPRVGEAASYRGAGEEK